MESANPFIAAAIAGGYKTKDQVVPFDKIESTHFLPSLDFALESARTHLKKLKSLPPSFENTILGLENCAEVFEHISLVFHNLFSSESTDEIQAMAPEVASRGATLSSEITLDSEIFAKVKTVYETARTGLNPEQIMLLDKTFRQFARNGALLNEQQKNQLRELDQKMAKITPVFSEHVLKATNAFELWIEKKEDLAGLPESVIEAAAHEAEKKNVKNKWLFTLHQPSFQPFLKHAKNRELRKAMYLAYGTRSFCDAFDNQKEVLEIVRLRHERSQLLGYANHAAFVLEERMAETPAKVMEFLNKLYEPSLLAAKRELEELQQFARETENVSDVMPWDFAYFAEKLREKKYSFNSEDLRPYFPIDQVVRGVFDNATQLYGLEFKTRKDIPVYHPEVAVYEVTEKESKEYIGLLYTDFFPRDSKRAGAWMTLYREQGHSLGENRRPHVSIVCNFTRPTPSKPSLLNFDEVVTLFHEFGHALHGLLSKCTYRSVAGTNVFWDFVELPSQFMENWAREKKGLDLFAKHFENSNLIPTELFDRLKRSEKFLAGYYSLRQLAFAFLDMAWHTTPPEQIKNVADFENQISEKNQSHAPRSWNEFFREL